MKRKIFLVSSLVVVAISAIAIKKYWTESAIEIKKGPEAKDEFRKLFEKYAKFEELDLTGVILLYDGRKLSEPKEVTPFRFAKWHAESMYELGALKVYYFENLIVQLDTSARLFAISNLPVTGLSDRQMIMQPFANLMDDSATLKTTFSLAINDSLNILEIESELNPSIKRYRVYYNPTTYTITKSEIEWWKEPGFKSSSESDYWLSLIYYRWGTGYPELVKQERDKVMSVKDGKFQAIGKYSNYEVVIQ